MNVQNDLKILNNRIQIKDNELMNMRQKLEEHKILNNNLNDEIN